MPQALDQVAELYRTMGDLFDEKYYQSAVDSYQFLLREYPTTHFREEALLAIAHIEQDDLHDNVLAQKSYEQFLALHPRSSHAAEVRAILDTLKAPSDAATPATKAAKTKARGDAESASKESSAEKAPKNLMPNRMPSEKQKKNCRPTPLTPRRQALPARRCRAFAPGTRICTRES